MLLFKHKPTKEQDPPVRNSVHQAAQAIASVIRCWQKKVALLLNSRFKVLSQRTQRGCLVLFCLLFGSCSLCLLLQALWPGTPEVVQATLFNYKAEPVRKKANFPPDLHPKELQRISGRLKALSRTAAGRHLRDSLLQARPSLVDSIHYLEQLHNNIKPNSLK
ncbi:hypothetical protein ACSX1A_11235 [Pontibacter sp. MBLB2868]|uniref:hypothetical protein n=1 Tax=Pontibacter sp. MBLB2868 TaxID=3451555 RepID=UPI003F74D0D5